MKYLFWLEVSFLTLILILLPLNTPRSFNIFNSSVAFAQNDSGSNTQAHSDASGGIGGMVGSSGNSTGSSNNSGGTGGGGNGGGVSGGNSSYAGSDFAPGNTPAQNKANANAGATSGNANNTGGSKSNGGPRPGPDTVGGTPGAPGAISPNYTSGTGAVTSGNKGSGTMSATQREALAKAHIYTTAEGGILGVKPDQLVHSDGSPLSNFEKSSLEGIGQAFGYDSSVYASSAQAIGKIYSALKGIPSGDTNAQNVPGRYLTPAEQQKYLADLGTPTPRTPAEQYALDHLVAACQAGCESVPTGLTYDPTYRTVIDTATGQPVQYRNIIYARVGIVAALNAANQELAANSSDATTHDKLLVTAGAGDVSVKHTGMAQIDNNMGGVDVVVARVNSSGTIVGGAISASDLTAAKQAMTDVGLASRLEGKVGDQTVSSLQAQGVSVAQYPNVTGLHFSTGLDPSKVSMYANNNPTSTTDTGNNPGNSLAGLAGGAGSTVAYSTTAVAGTNPTSSDPLRTLADVNRTIINDQQSIADLEATYAYGDGTKAVPADAQAQVAALNKEMAMAQNQRASLLGTPNPNTGVSSSGLKTNVSVVASSNSVSSPASQPVSVGGGLTTVSQGNMTIEGGTTVNVQNVYSGYGTANQKLVEIREVPVTQTASNPANPSKSNNKKQSSGAVILSDFEQLLTDISSWYGTN